MTLIASSLVNSGGCLSLSGFGRLGCSVSVFEASHLGLSISTDGEALLGSSLSVDGSRSGRYGRSNTTVAPEIGISACDAGFLASSLSVSFAAE